MSNYFYSRIHLATALPYDNKTNFLFEGLSKGSIANSHGFNYQFFNSKKITLDGSDYITAQLVKYEPVNQEEVVKEGEITETTLFNSVIAKARFFIDPNSSVIIYSEVRHHISKETFTKIFKELFEKNHDNFFTEISMTHIKEQYSFLERIEKFTAIKKVIINLVPSNPRFADRWKDIDIRLRSNHISNYKEIQENKKQGESISIDEQTKDKFLMSEDGYGNISASGIDENGKEKTISTKDVNKQVKTPVPAEDTKTELEILMILAETLQEIVKRTNN